MHSFIAHGALFQTFAASFMNVSDWTCVLPFITNSGLLLDFSPSLFSSFFFFPFSWVRFDVLGLPDFK